MKLNSTSTRHMNNVSLKCCASNRLFTSFISVNEWCYSQQLNISSNELHCRQIDHIHIL